MEKIKKRNMASCPYSIEDPKMEVHPSITKLLGIILKTQAVKVADQRQI